MARLIDADALLADMHNALCADCEDECDACQWRDAIKLIEQAPTVDAVEVIRCKDCMFFDREAKSETRDLHRCKITDAPVFVYDFCSCGEGKQWHG